MLNKVILQGRLTADPELKSTNNGVSVCSFTLAVDRSYQRGEKQTDFINCVAWRNTAEFISKYFAKGRMMIACGELQVRKYTAQDGQNRYAVEVVVNDVNFGGDKEKQDRQAETYAEPGEGFEEIVSDEELPF